MDLQKITILFAVLCAFALLQEASCAPGRRKERPQKKQQNDRREDQQSNDRREDQQSNDRREDSTDRLQTQEDGVEELQEEKRSRSEEKGAGRRNRTRQSNDREESSQDGLNEQEEETDCTAEQSGTKTKSEKAQKRREKVQKRREKKERERERDRNKSNGQKKRGKSNDKNGKDKRKQNVEKTTPKEIVQSATETWKRPPSLQDSIENCTDPSQIVFQINIRDHVMNGTTGVIVLEFPYQEQPSEPLEARSRESGIKVCPTTTVENRDTNRLPEVIYEVNCMCQNCYLPCGDSDQCPRGTCRPVTKEMTVLRRNGCIDDFYRYEWGTERVRVGCECVLPEPFPPFGNDEVCSHDHGA